MRPARLLAPAALVLAAIALFAILASGGSDTGKSDTPAAATATTTPKANKTAKPTATPSGGTYTVKPGDTPSGIAEKENVDVDDLLRVNPDVNPDALTVGDELKLP